MNKIITTTTGHSNSDTGAINGNVTETDITTEIRNCHLLPHSSRPSYS